MKGDVADFVARLSSVLPRGWFGENTPNLSAVLACLATPWSWLYGLIRYVSAQTRLSTTTDWWLDIFSIDFFGNGLPRNQAESDTSYRHRIRLALLQGAATRPAIVAGITALIGSAPTLFEPARCADTGSYGAATSFVGSGCAYGQAGGWGNLNLPYQFFITVTRPPTPGSGMLSGYTDAAGGWDVGSLSYVDLADLPGYVTDKDIRQALCKLLPVNTVAWLRIQ